MTLFLSELCKKTILKLRIEKNFFLRRYGLVKEIGVIPKKVIGKYLPKNAIILDIGANNGADSIEMVRYWNKATVYCFEPVPELFKKLNYNVRRYRRIKTYNFAIGEIDGLVKMYISEGNSDGSSSLLKPKEHLKDHPGVFFNNIIEVSSIKLKSWLEHNKISKVDLLWLDIQGMEQKMLEASKDILHIINVIYTEVSTKETYENVTKYEEFKRWLADYDFFPVYESIPENADMGNVLFAKKQ